MHGPTCVFWANLTPFTLKGGSGYSSEDAPLANRNVDVVVLFPNASDVQARMTTSETDALALFAIGGGVAFTQLRAFSVENRKEIYRVVRT